MSEHLFKCEICGSNFLKQHYLKNHQHYCKVPELQKAQEYEKYLNYQKAIELYDKIDKPEEAARVRKIVAEQKKVDQTVVHGDQVTKTEIKDSVLNRSNVGGKSSKSEELREAKALLDDGIIDDDEFKQMKKEILGK